MHVKPVDMYCIYQTEIVLVYKGVYSFNTPLGNSFCTYDKRDSLGTCIWNISKEKSISISKSHYHTFIFLLSLNALWLLFIYHLTPWQIFKFTLRWKWNPRSQKSFPIMRSFIDQVDLLKVYYVKQIVFSSVIGLRNEQIHSVLFITNNPISR